MEIFYRESKTSGGVIGYTLHANAVKRWILTQPQRARISRQCENMAGIHDDTTKRKDLGHTAKLKHEESVLKVMETIESCANPFDGTHEDLINIWSGVVASPACANDLANAYELGDKAVKKFFEERLFSNKISFYDKIVKSKLKTFSAIKVRKGKDVVHVESDRKMFARLLLLGKNSSINLKELMCYALGNVSFPLATEDGALGSTVKSKFRAHILKKYPGAVVPSTPDGGTLIIDAMAVVQGLGPAARPKTYGEFARKIFDICMTSGKSHERIDIVFDRYPSISIKSLTHEKRAAGQSSGLRVILGPEKTLPKQWNQYLRNGQNKELLIEFMFKEWSKYTDSIYSKKEVFVQHGKLCHKILGKNRSQLIQELESDQEEADTLMLLHADHAKSTYDTITINSDDTDVFLLCISHYTNVRSNFFLKFGKLNDKTIVNVKRQGELLGEELVKSLIGFHCFTGCDTTSSFHGKGKCRPWDLLCKSPELQKTFQALGESWEEISSGHFNRLQEFVCEIYSVEEKLVNDARYKLFLTKSFGEKKLPPNEDSLKLHVKRANYQARVHKLAVSSITNVPSPELHGWTVDSETNEVGIKWMTLDSAPKELTHVSKCSCAKTKCATKQCSCSRAGVSCTELCTCKDCENKDTTLCENDLLNDDSGSDDSDIDDE